MCRLDLVCVPEGVRDAVVEVLHVLIVLLPEVLEADAEGLGRIFWSISLKKLLLQFSPIVLVEIDNVIERVVP